MMRFVSSLICTAALACGGAAPASPVAKNADALSQEAEHDRSAKDELFAADARYTGAIESLGPVDGVLSRLRGDALYLAAGIDLVQGKRAIRKALEAANPDAAHTHLTRTLAGGDVSADGKFGFTFGWNQQVAPAGTSTVTTYGTYVTAWTREEDGEPFRVAAYLHRTGTLQHGAPRPGFPLLVGGPGAGGVPHPGEVEDQRRSILETDRRFAALSVAQGFSLAFPAYNFGFVLTTGRNDHFYILGAQEVIDWYAGWTPAEVLDWTPMFAGSSESGDLGFSVGKYVDSFTNPDGSVDRAFGKYLDFWARRADGAWRFITDGGASTPAP